MFEIVQGIIKCSHLGIIKAIRFIFASLMETHYQLVMKIDETNVPDRMKTHE
jgi:hypothetical protein